MNNKSATKICFKLIPDYFTASILRCSILMKFIVLILFSCFALPGYSSDLVDGKLVKKILSNHESIDSIAVFDIDENCFRRLVPKIGDTSYCKNSNLISGYPTANSVTITDKSRIKFILTKIKQEIADPPNDVLLCDHPTGVIVLYSRENIRIFEYDDSRELFETSIDGNNVTAYTKSNTWSRIRKISNLKFDSKKQTGCSD